MKKMILPLMAIVMLASCGGGETASDKTSDPVAEKPKDPAYDAGLALVAKNDCLTCHKIIEAFTGPSYTLVAEKYAGADAAKIKEVAEKIIKGGTGIWGSAMMTPHPSLSQEDAEAMVKYILLLKK
jgi:cytochrome c